MRFSQRSGLKGMHATLSPSQPAWMNYDPDKMMAVVAAQQAAQRGTELHAFAAEAIRLGIVQEDTGQTLNSYINDAIGFRMTPEQVLFWSENAFGTADAIDDRDMFLRIHDLKTGLTESPFQQLKGYAALYCLEYNQNPMKLNGLELRIYQSDEIKVVSHKTHPDLADEIHHVMEHIKLLDGIISKMKVEGI